MLKKLSQIPIVTLFLAAGGFVAYLKIPAAQEWVNAKCPQLKEPLTKLAATLHQTPDTGGATPSSDAAPQPQPEPRTAAGPSPTAAPDDSTMPSPATDSPAAPAAPAAAAQPGVFDLAQLSQSRAEWPKNVTLKKPVQFPAVLNGKVVGSVEAPAGAKTHLVLIKDNKLGLEYQGGGAMVDVNDTDLAEIVLTSRK